jgi:XTP/dITP diphosphohydrolase
VTRLVLASANPGKLRELEALLSPLGLEIAPQGALGVSPAAETGETFLDNALIKARHAADHTGYAALADDSGIEVDALGGRPGVWSARFAGDGASDEANLQRLLRELAGLPAAQDPATRSARYQSVIVVVRSAAGPEPLVARGTWEGHIAAAPRGEGGFGYDPVFVPRGDTRTAAELAEREKNCVSHRAQALRELLTRLPAYIRGP